MNRRQFLAGVGVTPLAVSGCSGAGGGDVSKAKTQRIFPKGVILKATESDPKRVWIAVPENDSASDATLGVTGHIFNMTGEDHTYEYEIRNVTGDRTLSSGALDIRYGSGDSVNAADRDAMTGDEIEFAVFSGALGTTGDESMNQTSFGQHSIFVRYG